MFGFGKKKEDPNRKALREEFETTCRKLRGAPELAQILLGNAINTANSTFHARFGSVEAFSRVPRSEQSAYMESLSKVVIALQEKNDPPSSMGFDLFKMWVGMVVARDAELINKFAQELAYFSKKGEGLSP